MVESGQYQRATGGRLPSWYQAQPPQQRGEEFYLKAFHRLGTERQFPGNGFGPIPWSRIEEYADRAGLDARMHVVFVDTILILDSLYREHMREENEKKAGKDARTAEKKAKQEAAKLAGTGGIQKRRAAGNH